MKLKKLKSHAIILLLAVSVLLCGCSKDSSSFSKFGNIYRESEDQQNSLTENNYANEHYESSGQTDNYGFKIWDGETANKIGNTVYAVNKELSVVRQGNLLYYFSYTPNRNSNDKSYAFLYASCLDEKISFYGYDLSGADNMAQPLLYVEGKPYDLNVIGDTVYYRLATPGFDSNGKYSEHANSSVYKAKRVTPENDYAYYETEKIIDGHLKNMIVIGNRIIGTEYDSSTENYFIEIYDINGKPIKEINIGENSVEKYLSVSEYEVYYSTYRQPLMLLDLNTYKNTEIYIKADKTFSIETIFENKIFINHGYGDFYRCNLNVISNGLLKGTKIRSNDSPTSILSINDGKVYFTDIIGDSILGIININDSEMQSTEINFKNMPRFDVGTGIVIDDWIIGYDLLKSGAKIVMRNIKNSTEIYLSGV